MACASLHCFVLESADRGWVACFCFRQWSPEGRFCDFLSQGGCQIRVRGSFFPWTPGNPYFPDHPEGRSHDDDDEDEEEEPESEREGKANNQSRLVSPNQALSRDAKIGNSAPLQHPGNPGVCPRFTKRLVASNIGRSSGQCKTAQFQFPAHFVRSHGDRIHGFVKLQGIYEDSINYVIYCHRRPRNLSKVYLTPIEWSRFVDDNGLKEGQELQFSLMADSYFLVRRLSG